MLAINRFQKSESDVENASVVLLVLLVAKLCPKLEPDRVAGKFSKVGAGAGAV